MCEVCVRCDNVMCFWDSFDEDVFVMNDDDVVI